MSVGLLLHERYAAFRKILSHTAVTLSRCAGPWSPKGIEPRLSRTWRSRDAFQTAWQEKAIVIPYGEDLRNVVDMEAIRAAGLKPRRRSVGRRCQTVLGAN